MTVSKAWLGEGFPVFLLLRVVGGGWFYSPKPAWGLEILAPVFWERCTTVPSKPGPAVYPQAHRRGSSHPGLA